MDPLIVIAPVVLKNCNVLVLKLSKRVTVKPVDIPKVPLIFTPPVVTELVPVTRNVPVLEYPIVDIKVNPPEIYNVIPESMDKVPVYPVLAVILITVTATFTVIEVLPLAELKKTVSALPGTDAPAAPPLVADQFVVEFHKPLPPETRYRAAILSYL